MLPRINQRPFILSALTLCMSGAASAATSTTHASAPDDDTVIVTANRSESSLWDSPATIQVIDRQTLQNSTNVSIADDLQDIPGVESPITPSQGGNKFVSVAKRLRGC